MTPLEKLTRPLKVNRKIQETPDACTFVLEIPPAYRADFAYRPGQFVTLFLNIQGQDVRRSYSLSTSPLTDMDFRITVKRVQGGLGSTYLVNEVKEGDTLNVSFPTGTFFSPPSQLGAHHYLLFAAGSGITPIYSIAKSVLAANVENRVTLFFQNRKEADIIYRQELDSLAGAMKGRLEVVHQLTRPAEGWSGPSGRLSLAGFQDLASRFQSSLPKECYLCGPVEFMKLVREGLMTLGVSPSNIHIESFGEPMEPAKSGVTIQASTVLSPDPNRVWIGPDRSAPEKPRTLVALLGGEQIEISAAEGQTVLETLLAAGYNAPYSCMEGACMACMGKVRKGQIYQKDPGILTDDNMESGDCLTCQAIPASTIVHVDYDNL